MRRLRHTLIGLIAGSTLLAGCEGNPFASFEKHITFASQTQQPHALITQHLAESLSPYFSVSIEPRENVNQIIASVLSRETDFAIIEQPPQSVAELTTVTPLFPSVLHVLVRRELHNCEEQKNLSELLTLGKIWAGPPGSTGYTLLDNLAGQGWLPDMGQLTMLETPFGVQPDVWLDFGGIYNADALSRLNDYCLASLGAIEQFGQGSWAEGISYRFPHLSAFVLPAGLYPNLSVKPVVTLAVTSLLVTHASQPDELVHDVLQHVIESGNSLQSIYPLTSAVLSNEAATQPSTLALHPGALRFAQRDAPSFLERYAEVLAFTTTALVALASLFAAVYRIRQQAKKDRLDEYFAQVMKLRDLHRQGDLEAPQLYAQVSDLQDGVTRLVVQERIEADSAYVAFLTFSNQVLFESEKDL